MAHVFLAGFRAIIKNQTEKSFHFEFDTLFDRPMLHFIYLQNGIKFNRHSSGKLNNAVDLCYIFFYLQIIFFLYLQNGISFNRHSSEKLNNAVDVIVLGRL